MIHDQPVRPAKTLKNLLRIQGIQPPHRRTEISGLSADFVTLLAGEMAEQKSSATNQRSPVLLQIKSDENDSCASFPQFIRQGQATH